MDHLLKKIWVYILFFIASIAFFGGLIYYFYALNNLGVIISFLFSILSLIAFIYFDHLTNQDDRHSDIVKPRNENYRKIIYAFPVLYLLLFFACLYLLIEFRTDSAIISPWQKLPGLYFLLYGCASLVMMLSIYFKNKFQLAIIILHALLSFSVSVIVYKLGYGYDPFIHNATIDLIKKTGSVDPKPYYYLGQYALIVILNKVTVIPVFWLDKLLVPFLAGLFLPAVFLRFCRRWFDNINFSYIAITLLFILPYSIFISTTPQNLAYLFLLMVVIIGLSSRKTSDQILIMLLSLAALITQPIAGIPALIFSLIIIFYHQKRAMPKKLILITLLVILSLSIPAAFYSAEKNISRSDEASLETDLSRMAISDFYIQTPNQENIILNLAYTYIFNIKFLLVILSAAGLYVICKHRDHCRIFLILPLVALSLIIAYFLTTLLPFRFLINYERTDYALRILNVLTIFLVPLILISLYAGSEKIIKQNVFLKISCVLLFASLAGAVHYYSYPRYDNYFNSHGYSVSADDIEAVRWINKNSGQDYIVLANQQVSAAAVKEFGFTKYFKNDIFYYPIPTGGALYPYYLDMVYKEPSRRTMFSAMDLAGVKQSYFILNKYWWASPKILAEAKLSADGWQEIGKGQIYIFSYKK